MRPRSESDPLEQVRDTRRRLQFDRVDLVGGGRTVQFRPGLNLVQGDITTGKTTFVRLLRALLGNVPDGLPREVDHIEAIRATVLLGDTTWQIYRPLTTTPSAPVEIVEATAPEGREPVALRLPAGGPPQAYSGFLLDQLDIPAVRVPQAKSRPTGTLVPVTMTDWLAYCIVTGDELDAQVFGHEHPFRDQKRKYVFELAYGYYDAEAARLTSQLRAVELRMEALAQESAVLEKFLADTPFANPDVIRSRIADVQQTLDALRAAGAAEVGLLTEAAEIRQIRDSLLSSRRRRTQLQSERDRTRAQIEDLTDLARQLTSQSARLTRAIVADEWLVDFDFVVCPRCGNDIDASRTSTEHCYLCLQTPRPAASRDNLLAEQSRINSQIAETEELIILRTKRLAEVSTELAELETSIDALAKDLNAATAAFVSDRASQLQQRAAEQARLESELVRLNEYLNVFARQEAHNESREDLEAKLAEIRFAIERREFGQANAEANTRALERRILAYLTELNVPVIDSDLTVKINRKTYLPEVSGRSFDELSSQGLKTLVNVAHALAHHTVAIDRGLPLPGLLVLDGLSANAGYEGFDLDRVIDMYRLLAAVTEEYEDQLQVVAVDNELPRQVLMELAHTVILNLTPDDRLIRLGGATT